MTMGAQTIGSARAATEEFADRLFVGDASEVTARFPDDCIDLIVTSPPYWTAVEYDGGQDKAWPSYDAYLAAMMRVWRECARVLRPNGKLLILEITAPESAVARGVLGAYMGGIVPAISSVLAMRASVGRMMRYYWATTRDCVRPDVILDAMRKAGFGDAKRNVDMGIFSNYSGVASA